jgi:hypothetical protein
MKLWKKNINKELTKTKNIRTNIMVIKIDRKNSMRLKLYILKMILNKINSNKKNRNPVWKIKKIIEGEIEKKNYNWIDYL